MAFTTLLLALAVLIAFVLYISFSKPTDLEKLHTQLPSIGAHTGFLASLRNQIDSVGDVRSLIRGGYQKFSKLNQAFVYPSLQATFVLVPQTDIKWVADSPDHVLSAKYMQKQMLQSDITLLDPEVADNPTHLSILRRDLTRGINTFIPDLEDESAIALSEYWGNDTEEWKDVKVYDTMMKVIARTSNRVFVGLPLCRNEEYLANAQNFALDIAITGNVIRLLPEFLKPFVSWFLILPNRLHHYKCAKHLLPLIHQRIQEPSSPESLPDHNDFIDWLITASKSSPNPDEAKPERIALRLMTVNFVSIHTSTFTATSVLFDIWSSPTVISDVVELRAEIEEVFNQNGRQWDKNAIAKLFKVDSALRESLRISTFFSYGMTRLVVDPNGVTMKSGLHLPAGTSIGTPTCAIHFDESIYENPAVYQPFRFSRAREEFAAGNQKGDEGNAGKVLQSKNLAAATTSDHFLAFGHGKHACPGRFFAISELKMLLAHIIMNYDIQPLASRPPATCYGSEVLPPMSATLSVRRRK